MRRWSIHHQSCVYQRDKRVGLLHAHYYIGGRDPTATIDVCNKMDKGESYLTGPKFAHNRAHVCLYWRHCVYMRYLWQDFQVQRSSYRTHTGELSNTCDICKMSFPHHNNLTRHKLIHAGERPFRCVECDKPFTKMSYLVVHMRMHTGELPYTCDVCRHIILTES